LDNSAIVMGRSGTDLW